MTVAKNHSNYTPVEDSTPTNSNYNTPISTPSRAALLRPSFLTSGSPIKFSLTPDKLKDVEFDEWEDDNTETKRHGFWKLSFLGFCFLTWIILVAAAIYLSVEYIITAALGVLRWSDSIKTVYRVGLALTTLGAGFSIGCVIHRFLNFSRAPWKGSWEQPRPLIVNWIMFIIFLIGLPVASTVIPFILGRTGQFNSSYQAWNNACEDPRFTSMFHIKYVASIGNAFSLTMYARSVQGTYYYLGLLPTSSPSNPQVNLTTPNFVLFPTTDPPTPEVAAAQRLFTLTTNDYTSPVTELIASVSLDMTDPDNQSIVARCLNSTNESGDLATCLNGALQAGTGVPVGPIGANPFLMEEGNKTKTLEIMYDILPAETDSTNTTSLRGFLNSWPSSNQSFMSGGIASQTPPNGILELSDSGGVILDEMGVQVVNSPWPGCNGLMVCATQGINGMIVAGWLWQNLDKWMWYSEVDCQL